MANLMRIGVPAAWDVTTGSSNVVVAVIDSGVFYEHEDLQANLWRNPGEVPGNGIDDDGNGYIDDVYGIDAHNHDADPLDDCGHGTYCAGIIGAVGNNGQGGVGVNWSVQIMALKYSGPEGFGHDADVVECFEYVIQMKQRGVNVRVTNNSYGGDENGPAVRDAIDVASNAGILNVFAAGNEARDTDAGPFYPAGFDSPGIIAVASTDPADCLSTFSNYGWASVDLAAPGEEIWTTGLGRSAYLYFAGTSAACPQVAGAAALLLAYAPGLSLAELKAALLGSVDVLPELQGKVASNGRLDVARALQVVARPDAPVIVASVSPVGNRTPVTAAVMATFTKPMNRATVETAFSLTPGAAGAFAWSNDDRTFTFTPSAPFTPGASYTARIAGTAQDEEGATLDGNYSQASQGSPADDFVWSFRVPPRNDGFADAEMLTGRSGLATGTNRNATRERGEPAHAGDSGGATVWFQWRAPVNCEATFDTSGSDFATLLAVYVGEQVTSLTRVTGASSDEPGSICAVKFRAVGEAVYYVAVDGVTGDDYEHDYPQEGELVLNWATGPLGPVPPPVISGLVPTRGGPGAKVQIHGTNFIGATAVQFGGVEADFKIAADSLLVAMVPAAGTSGKVAVTTPVGTAISSEDFVISPSSGLVRLVIRGKADGALEIVWSASLADYQLEATDRLGQSDGWLLVPGVVLRAGEMIWTTDSPVGTRFFRLRRP